MSDILEYISEDRRIEIAEEAFREACRDRFSGDPGVVFSNAAYAMVWRLVDDMFDGDAAQAVADKLPEIIDGLTDFSVFRHERFGAGKSEGQKALDRAVIANQDAINAAVRKAAEAIDRNYILDAVLDADFKVSIERAP
ncbi:MAG: hypothetical protein AAFS03_11710 [Pseudomonadota bacterium]